MFIGCKEARGTRSFKVPHNQHPFIQIGYGVAVTSVTLTHQPGVRLPVSENLNKFLNRIIPSFFVFWCFYFWFSDAIRGTDLGTCRTTCLKLQSIPPESRHLIHHNNPSTVNSETLHSYFFFNILVQKREDRTTQSPWTKSISPEPKPIHNHTLHPPNAIQFYPSPLYPYTHPSHPALHTFIEWRFV